MTSSRPKLLDLFCGAGGCSFGYSQAGFDVVGVDIVDQPNHPGSGLFTPGVRFVRADAMSFARRHASAFDAVHASPPCQAHSALRHLRPHVTYECFIERTRDILSCLNCPWVIENVPGAPLRNAVMLCGSAFGLRVRRHRLFESNISLQGTKCRHKEQGRPIDVSGTGGRRVTRRPDDHGGNTNKPRNIREGRAAMGVDWMRRYELSQAIPPAYTKFIGWQLLSALSANTRPTPKEPRHA
jgi:DNA (cytosine-5)-methyltransferase 1